MSSAFVFPGQGSQHAGMGKDLYAAFAEAREVFDTADRILGFALSELCFGESTAALKSTDVTQPALYTHSAAVMSVLRRMGHMPDMVAGHSVGEIAALYGAEAIEFEAGLQLVRFRGQLMAKAGKGRPGAMAAVLGMDEDGVHRLCDDASDSNTVVVAANYNAPGQIVVSGDVRAVDRLVLLARRRGARRVVRLSVSGAFHSPLMEGARQEFAGKLFRLNMRRPKCPVYLNVTAGPTLSSGEILEAMFIQLTAPVLWSQTLHRMRADGAERFVEAGPGRVLSGLVRRTLGRGVETLSIGSAADFMTLAEA